MGILMIKDRIVEALKNRMGEKPEREVSQAAAKIENQKRLSTKEFLKVYDAMWQAGPQINYQNPGARERELQLNNKNPNLF
jgi:hypothetical protein